MFFFSFRLQKSALKIDKLNHKRISLIKNKNKKDKNKILKIR